MFKLHDTTVHDAMNCRADHSTYFPKEMGKKVLATFEFTLLVTMNSGFGYAMGEIPAGVHLSHFYRVRKGPVLAEFMHGAPAEMHAEMVHVSAANVLSFAFARIIIVFLALWLLAPAVCRCGCGMRVTLKGMHTKPCSRICSSSIDLKKMTKEQLRRLTDPDSLQDKC